MNAQLPQAVAPGEGELIDFPELWRTVRRYWTSVLAITILGGAAGALVAFSMEPVYEAQVTILIQTKADRPVQVQDVYDPGYGTNEYLATQAALLRTADVVGRVVDRLDLTKNDLILPPPQPPFWAQWRDWLPLLPDVEPPAVAPAPEIMRQRAINAVLGDLTVTPVFRTQLVQARFASPSPALSAQVVNALGEVFVENGLESRAEVTERTTRWLTERMGDLRSKLDASEHALQAFREQNQLVNVGGARGLYEEELLDNSRKLRDAQRKKTELASTYWKIQQAGASDEKLQEISTLLLDPPVQRAAANYTEAQQAVHQLEERYGAKHPQMSSANARLQQAQSAYYQQLRLAANGVKAEYEIAAETERALTSVVDVGTQRIRKLDQADFQLKALEREVETNRQLYDTFLKRFKETDTVATFEETNARIVDRATPPRLPSKPQKGMLVLFSLAGGFVVALILAVLRHLLTETVRSPEHLEHLTQLPVISVLPPVSGLGRKTSPPALCLEQPRAPFPEGVRTIRASLHLSDVDKRVKRVMFTSAVPQEGKSSLASSFAAVLGQSERVVLVEADLRAPSQKRIFGIPKDAPGLLEVLTGEVELAQALFHHAASGIDVLPVAKVPPNPAEVVASAAFAKLTDTLAERYDRVVFDTPPCGVASDSLLLAHRMDAVLFVIHGGRTSVRTVQAAIRQLRGAQAPLLGHVLNQVDARKAFGYGGRYYAYGYYGK